eukprot:TRINITY_DN80174_c0_g1_i1.p1 TRINITY_DN80174_c0_g1~~TRINITY_DN80174_c0_g1_i1.p1  ORF type:complete len:270 (-),score=89.61 TRINITY_DN80174_c0_g1_i1:446-1255(-)
MSWRFPLLELSVATLVKDPEKLCLPEEIATLPSHIKDRILKSLSHRDISPGLLKALLHKNVTELDLQDIDITDEHLQVVAQFKNYKKLNFNQTKKPSFKIVEKSENVPPPPSDSALCHVLTGAKYLQSIFLAGWVNLGLSSLQTLATNCPLVRYLDLGNCAGLDDRGLEVLSEHLCYLESLSLTGTAITDAGLSRLGVSDSASTLKELRINKCRDITDQGIEMLLAGLQALEILIFNGCPQVTDDSRMALDRYLREHRVNVRQLSWTVY